MLNSVEFPPRETLELYRQAFHANGRSEAALLWTKNKQSVRFEALCNAIPDGPTTLLDYGRGLGDLATWLHKNRPSIRYVGTDAVQEFIASNKRAMPAVSFATANHPGDVDGSFDHVVCCGVFNLDPQGTAPRHWNHIKAVLAALFSKTRISLHVDFLAHDVDYRQDNAHHQDPCELARFIETDLSKRYCIDRTYMPFEYCASIFADQTVAADQNIYVAKSRSPGA
jgi:hypothetical protein